MQPPTDVDVVRAWEFSDVHGDVAALRRALLEGRGGVVSGDAGAGKEALARLALDEFASTADANAAVWAVENCSTSLGRPGRITPTAVGRGAPLVLVCNGNHRSVASGEALPLCLAPDLERIRVRPLTRHQTGALVEGLTGASPSAAAVDAVWRASCGQRRWAALLIWDWLESGRLEAVGSTWMRPQGAEIGPRFQAAVASLLATLDPAAREAVETVAVIGGSPLSALLQAADPDGVDAAYDIGLLETVGTGVSTVRMKTRLLEDCVAGNVPPGRAAALRQRVRSVLEAAGRKPGSAAVVPPGPAEGAGAVGVPGTGHASAGSLTSLAALSAVGRHTDLLAAETPHGLDAGERLQWESLRHLALVAVGDGARGTQAVRDWFRERAVDDAPLQEQATSGAFAALGLAGELAACAEILRANTTGDRRLQLDARVLGAFSSVSRIAAGHLTEAHAALRPELRQAEADGGSAQLLSFGALTAAATGRHAEAADLLREVEAAPGELPAWIEQLSTTLFAASAHAILTSPRQAGEDLAQAAAAEQQRGNHGAALLLLAHALRLGHRPAMEQLAAEPLLSTSRFALVCRDYARGVLSRDPGLVLSAAHGLSRLGHLGFAREAGAAARRMGAGAGDVRRALEAVELGFAVEPDGAFRGGPSPAGRGGRVPAAGPDMVVPGEVPSPMSWDALAGRQRDVARLVAAGLSNRAVAQELGLSVRTVESHLYQVYARLGVRDRADLANYVQRRPVGHLSRTWPPAPPIE